MGGKITQPSHGVRPATAGVCGKQPCPETRIDHTESPRLDMHGRPVKVEIVNCGNGWHMARVWSGEVIIQETRIHSFESEAERHGERWLAKYLETGSWTEATDWHEKHYWGSAS